MQGRAKSSLLLLSPAAAACAPLLLLPPPPNIPNRPLSADATELALAAVAGVPAAPDRRSSRLAGSRRVMLRGWHTMTRLQCSVPWMGMKR
jgi:hypothetical protein